MEIEGNIVEPETSVDSDPEGDSLQCPPSLSTNFSEIPSIRARLLKNYCRTSDVVNDRKSILSGISSDEEVENVDDEVLSDNVNDRTRILEDAIANISKVSDDISCDDSGIVSNVDSNDDGVLDKEMIGPGSVFDTHCHLEFIKRRFRNVNSLEDCMKMDGEDLGDKFLGCIVNYCQPSEWSRGSKLTEVSELLRNSARDGRVGITIGCHPHFADHMSKERWEQFESLISSPSPEFPWLRVVAVGECGLDYSHKNSVPKETQIKVFTKQLEIAMKYKIPVVIHIRDAEKDGLKVLKDAGVPEDFPIHRHCFGGNLEDAKTWLSKYSECKLGFTGLVTYSHASHVHKVVEHVDIDRILLETDAPYFLPSGARKNSMNCSFPGHVIHVAAKIAELKKVTLSEILQKNLTNSQKIYKRFFDTRPVVKTVRARIIPELFKIETSLNDVKSVRPKLIK